MVAIALQIHRMSFASATFVIRLQFRLAVSDHLFKFSLAFCSHCFRAFIIFSCIAIASEHLYSIIIYVCALFLFCFRHFSFRIENLPNLVRIFFDKWRNYLPSSKKVVSANEIKYFATKEKQQQQQCIDWIFFFFYQLEIHELNFHIVGKVNVSAITKLGYFSFIKFSNKILQTVLTGFPWQCCRFAVCRLKIVHVIRNVSAWVECIVFVCMCLCLCLPFRAFKKVT